MTFDLTRRVAGTMKQTLSLLLLLNIFLNFSGE